MRILSIFGKCKDGPEKLICFSILSKGLRVGEEIEFGNNKYLITRIAKLSRMMYQNERFPLIGIYGKLKGDMEKTL